MLNSKQSAKMGTNMLFGKPDKLLWSDRWWTTIPSTGCRNTSSRFKVNKLFVTEACLHGFIRYICTCFLCAAVKTGKIILFLQNWYIGWAKSEKLGPTVRKQKINTFKYLYVMHKYFSVILAGLSRERLKVQIPCIGLYFGHRVASVCKTALDGLYFVFPQIALLVTSFIWTL